jgi:ribonuclease D
MSEDLKPLWIDTPEGLREAAGRCASASWIALDTEADSMHSYFHKVCLIQISANGDHMVIDPLAVEPGDLQPLWDVVGDPDIPVLMHGADYDIRILDRDYGIRIGGLQDTQIMAQLLGEEKTGLAALLEKELGVALDKKFQRADWGRRPLKAAQLAYAAADTAYLGRLVDRLRARLEELQRWVWAEEEFRKLELVRHSPVEADPLAFERIKGARRLRGAARDRLYSLYDWRDRQARSRDIPPFKILGNKALMAMAEKIPSNLDELSKIEGVGSRAVRRWGRSLLKVIDRPRRAPERVRPPRPPTPDAAERRRVKRLLAARDAVAGGLEIQAGLLCPRGVAESVASRRPPCSSRRDLADAGLVGWRLEVLGDSFLGAIVED